jgi:hypothetical protein
VIQGQTPNHVFCFNECQDYWAAEESGVNHTSFKELLTLARLNARIKSTLLSRNFKIVNISSIGKACQPHRSVLKKLVLPHCPLLIAICHKQISKQDVWIALAQHAVCGVGISDAILRARYVIQP